MKKYNRTIISFLIIGIILIGYFPVTTIANANKIDSINNTSDSMFENFNLTDGLVGYWSFNNQSNVAYDDSGNNNNGINHGATWTENGIQGGALDFERDLGNYLNFSSPVLNTPPYTICAWVKPESLPSNDNWFIICNGAETSHSYGFSIYVHDPTLSPRSYHFSSKNVDAKGNGLDYLVDNNEWIYLCGTWDGSLNQDSIKFYVNGEIIGMATPIETIVNGPERNLFIGKDTDGWGSDDTGHYFDGLIDEIKIYNKVLNQENIRDLYKGTMIVEQNLYRRGFPIRCTLDGNWGGGQCFNSTFDLLTSFEIYIRKFGSPEFNISIELREGSIQGTLIDSFKFKPEDITDNWDWYFLNLNLQSINTGLDYFIIIAPPGEVSTSNGYEWGYAFGNQYDDGSFWFTRDGGNLWRDLPTMYDFMFRVFGY